MIKKNILNSTSFLSLLTGLSFSLGVGMGHASNTSHIVEEERAIIEVGKALIQGAQSKIKDVLDDKEHGRLENIKKKMRWKGVEKHAAHPLFKLTPYMWLTIEGFLDGGIYAHPGLKTLYCMVNMPSPLYQKTPLFLSSGGQLTYPIMEIRSEDAPGYPEIKKILHIISGPDRQVDHVTLHYPLPSTLETPQDRETAQALMQVFWGERVHPLKGGYIPGILETVKEPLKGVKILSIPYMRDPEYFKKFLEKFPNVERIVLTNLRAVGHERPTLYVPEFQEILKGKKLRDLPFVFKDSYAVEGHMDSLEELRVEIGDIKQDKVSKVLGSFPNLRRLYLVVNAPSGAVDGLEPLSKAISNLKELQKLGMSWRGEKKIESIESVRSFLDKILNLKTIDFLDINVCLSKSMTTEEIVKTSYKMEDYVKKNDDLVQQKQKIFNGFGGMNGLRTLNIHESFFEKDNMTSLLLALNEKTFAPNLQKLGIYGNPTEQSKAFGLLFEKFKGVQVEFLDQPSWSRYLFEEGGFK